jgi:hypothetical protein
MAKQLAPTIIRRNYTAREFIAKALENGVSKGGKGNADWAGGSFDDAVAMATGKGYEEVIPKVKEYLSFLETDLAEAMHMDFETIFDVSGSFVDMGRYLSGDPENMMDCLPVPTMKTGRVLKVAVPICYSHTVPAKTVLNRGIAVMAMVEAFSILQHPMEVWAVMGIHGSKPGVGAVRLNYNIKVQDADQPVNMGRLMYWLAHPTVLRQLCFAVEETEESNVQRWFNIGASYGHGSYAIDLEDMSPIHVDNAIILPELDYQNCRLWDSEEKTVDWIVSQFDRITKDPMLQSE